MAPGRPAAGWRALPLITGLVGGTLVGVNHILTGTLLPSQARADALGIGLSALLVLTGLLWQTVQPRPAEAVQLEGTPGLDWADALPEQLKETLAWASYTLLTQTATGSVVVWYKGATLLRRGVLGPAGQVEPGPILSRVLTKGQAIYLVDLKLYPGRVEFDYLPPNTQGVLILPLGGDGALILAAHTPRGYSPQDQAWMGAIAEHLVVQLARQGRGG